LGHFGRHCHLKYDQCHQNACLNNGTCYPSYDPSGEQPLICTCLERFYGNRCENEKSSVHVRFNMTSEFAPRATVFQLYDIIPVYLTLEIRHQKVYDGLPSIITSHQPDNEAPPIGLLKAYEDSQNPYYYVVYVSLKSVINITSSPQHCPDVSSLSSTGHFHFQINNHIILILILSFR
jgi:hypothetical protein